MHVSLKRKEQEHMQPEKSENMTVDRLGALALINLWLLNRPCLIEQLSD